MQPEVAVPQVTVDELAAAVEAGGAVLDVRMPDEFAEAHVPGAVLIPLPELPERAHEVPADQLVHVICRSGGRSQKACEFLAARGHRVANVAGGTLAWIESGRAITTGTEAG
ncbi:MAG TPA: rhodanese-like domain-containing protein [Microthrixaceae bacterium]|jgi:rhodanese-related sulfurtransferase|nr:rhodanese-like domain-containing protein [Microthrixaceae bacterium]